jgi:hypothetical protein
MRTHTRDENTERKKKELLGSVTIRLLVSLERSMVSINFSAQRNCND